MMFFVDNVAVSQVFLQAFLVFYFHILSPHLCSVRGLCVHACACVRERERGRDLINKSKIYFKPRGTFMVQSWKHNELEP